MLVRIEPTAIELPELVTVPPSLTPLAAAAKRGASLYEPIDAITRSMGYTTFSYGMSSGRALKGDERFYVWTTAPATWVAEYDQRSYVEIDPRITHAWTHLPPPLIWDRSIARGKPEVCAFLDRAASFGVGSGVAIYLHEYATKVIVALSQPQRSLTARRRAQMSAKLGDAMALASIFHLIFMRDIMGTGRAPLQQGSPLSPRERQCLQLAAHGMTSLDIGAKLGISERTANFHFSNILSKLGVLNRKEAIAQGVAHGLIHVNTSNTPIAPLTPSRVREAQIRRWEARHNAQNEPSKR